MTRQRVALIFGGRSVEHAVSLTSARTVRSALVEAGFEVVTVGVAPDGSWLDPRVSAAALDDGRVSLDSAGEPVAASLRHLLTVEADVLFPLIHGTWGEDGTLQGLCEMLDRPYVGADVGASALAMDKVVAKKLLAAAGVRVVEYRATRRGSYQADPDPFLERCGELPLPLFVKPAAGGSSVGVTKVTGADGLPAAIEDALRFDESVLVERGVRGREIECAVRGDEILEAAAALGEIVPGREFYDYEDKYLGDTATLIAPVELPFAVAADIRAQAVAAFGALGGTGMARVDFLLEADGTAYVNEINTVPGFTAISMYPRLWEHSGVSLPELVTSLVEDAGTRHQRRHQLDRGIKSWLAGLVR